MRFAKTRVRGLSTIYGELCLEEVVGGGRAFSQGKKMYGTAFAKTQMGDTKY